ncbi:hypothetical protein ES705_30081 [subsurface metagenome]
MPLPSFSEDIEKNIIRHIKYRGTIRTGEIIVDNGDGTYDVKIALSDVVYPSIETIHYEMVFAVGEMAVLAFEYGSKESPKIIGHGKKIAQVPVEVEVDYSGAEIDIDIGSPKIYLESWHHFGHTFIAKENPANGTGRITSLELRAQTDMSGVIIATFTKVNTKIFTARDHVHLADIPAAVPGLSVTRTVDIDGNPISLDVVNGDYIGMYWSGGDVEFETEGVGTWHYAGDQTSCVGLEFAFGLGGLTISLYGTGA